MLRNTMLQVTAVQVNDVAHWPFLGHVLKIVVYKLSFVKFNASVYDIFCRRVYNQENLIPFFLQFCKLPL